MVDIKYNETPRKLKTADFMVSEENCTHKHRIYLAEWQLVKIQLKGSHSNFNQAESQFNVSLFA